MWVRGGGLWFEGRCWLLLVVVGGVWMSVVVWCGLWWCTVCVVCSVCENRNLTWTKRRNACMILISLRKEIKASTRSRSTKNRILTRTGGHACMILIFSEKALRLLFRVKRKYLLDQKEKNVHDFYVEE